MDLFSWFYDRKVEDLQFTMEEASIDKVDLEVWSDLSICFLFV